MSNFLPSAFCSSALLAQPLNHEASFPQECQEPTPPHFHLGFWCFVFWGGGLGRRYRPVTQPTLSPLCLSTENLMKPNKTVNSTGIIKENGTTSLACNTENEDLPDIQWYFQNKKLILNERKTLSEHGQTLTIMPVKREDSGAYQCEVWNPFLTNISDLFNLTVICEWLWISSLSQYFL